jgi:hypothetical protein
MAALLEVGVGDAPLPVHDSDLVGVEGGGAGEEVGDEEGYLHGGFSEG